MRLKYVYGEGAVLRIRAYGRFNSDEPWTVIRNLANMTTAEIAPTPGVDCTDSAYSYTVPTTSSTRGIATGAASLLILVELALDTGNSTDDNLAELEAKMA